MDINCYLQKKYFFAFFEKRPHVKCLLVKKEREAYREKLEGKRKAFLLLKLASKSIYNSFEYISISMHNIMGE